MSKGITLQGLTGIFNALEKVQADFAKARRKAFTRIAFKIKAQAVKYAPVITGNLRGSAATEVTDDFARISFSAFYAVFVHENMEGRGAKFLERAVNENRDFILDELKEAAPK